MAEYQALILGLQMEIQMRIKDLDVYGGSQLFVNKLLKESKVQKDDLIPDHKLALWLLDRLEIVKLEHVPRIVNKMANAVTKLAATLALRGEENITIRIYGR